MIEESFESIFLEAVENLSRFGHKIKHFNFCSKLLWLNSISGTRTHTQKNVIVFQYFAIMWRYIFISCHYQRKIYKFVMGNSYNISISFFSVPFAEKRKLLFFVTTPYIQLFFIWIAFCFCIINDLMLINRINSLRICRVLFKYIFMRP